MGLGRVITLGIGVFLGSLLAQDCAPVARILPSGTLAGALDTSSCQLLDTTPYIAYRLDLPARGQIAIQFSAGPGDLTLQLRDATGTKVVSGASIGGPIEAGSNTLLDRKSTRLNSSHLGISYAG